MPETDPQLIFHKQIKRAKQERECTADSLSELICLVDFEGNILRANRSIDVDDDQHAG